MSAVQLGLLAMPVYLLRAGGGAEAQHGRTDGKQAAQADGQGSPNQALRRSVAIHASSCLVVVDRFYELGRPRRAPIPATPSPPQNTTNKARPPVPAVNLGIHTRP